MIRSLLGLLVVIGVLLPGAVVLASPGPPLPTPTPHAQQTALTGRVPAPSGTAVTLKAMDLNVGFKDCGTSTTRAGPDDSPDTSSFEFVLDGACLAGTEGVLVCWSPRLEDCNIVAVSAGMLGSGLVGVDVPSFTELGQTLRTGLLVPLPTEFADGEEISPNVLRHAADSALPLAEPADGGQQIPGPSGSGPGPGPGRDQQIADLSQSEQGGRYGWLLWAGAAMLVAGLALAAGVGVRARRS